MALIHRIKSFFQEFSQQSFLLFFLSLIVALFVLLFNEAVWFRKNHLHQEFQSLLAHISPHSKEVERIVVQEKSYRVLQKDAPWVITITQEGDLPWETIQEEKPSQHFLKEAYYSLITLLPPIQKTALRLEWHLNNQNKLDNKTPLVITTFSKAPIHKALLHHLTNRISLCVLIAFFIGLLTGGINHITNIRPIRSLDRAMETFEQDPLRFRFSTLPSKRYFPAYVRHIRRTLGHVQRTLRSMLRQREHLASLGESVMKITHDVKNMMASLQLFLNTLPQTHNTQEKKARTHMLSVVEHIVNFCSQTLAYGREGHQKQQDAIHVPKHLHLKKVLQQCLIPYQRKTVTINCDVPQSHTIVFPQNVFIRIVSNFLENSFRILESMPPKKRHIRFSSQKKGDTIQLTIQDTGPGIPKRIRDHLFRPFLTSSGQGRVGLGLSIIKELMTTHGGYVKLLRTGGDGTTFLCAFPTLPTSALQRESANTQNDITEFT